MNVFETLGLDMELVVLIILGVLIITILLLVISMVKQSKLTKKYDKFMRGSNGKTLEATILHRFDEIESLKEKNDTLSKAVAELTETVVGAYQKCGIVKYDAFKEMGGKLSFSLCMLNDYNDGIILTSMHSSREGCYTYVKEIIKGESFVLLSEEEKQALEEAKNKKNYLQ